MEFVTLGRTGMHVSVVGLGGGGFSRLGQSTGRTETESIAVVRRALDLGITFIDTSEAYGTESIVGRGIAGQRDRVTLCTKKVISVKGNLIRPEDVAAGLDQSLGRLGTDRVEIYLLHGVPVEHYDYCRDQLVPELRKLVQLGKVRAIGITEGFSTDVRHATLSRAVQDDCWDVVMVGFNLLNQSARERVLRQTIAKNIAVLDMFAVRQALSQPHKLQQIMDQLVTEQRVERTWADGEGALDFLLRDGVVASLTEAAYRFCRAEPGVHVVLTGTGSVPHLEQNVRDILKGPLPQVVRQRLMRMFQKVDSVSGQ